MTTPATRIRRHTVTGASLILIAGASSLIDIDLMPKLLGVHLTLNAMVPLDGDSVAILLPLFGAFACVSVRGTQANGLDHLILRMGVARAQLAGCVLTGLCMAAATSAIRPDAHLHSQPVAGVGYLALAVLIAGRIAAECLPAEAATIAQDDDTWQTQQARMQELHAEATRSTGRAVVRLGTVVLGCALIPFLLDLTVSARAGSRLIELPLDALTDVAINALVAAFALAAVAVNVLTRIYDAVAMRMFFAVLTAIVPVAVVISCFRFHSPTGSPAILAVTYALMLTTPWTILTLRWLRATQRHHACLPVRSLAIRMACAHATRVGKKHQQTRVALGDARRSS